MATVKKNPVIEGLNGGVGKLVFKQYGDKTVVCKWPDADQLLLNCDIATRCQFTHLDSV